jgi:hypothetical protein
VSCETVLLTVHKKAASQKHNMCSHEQTHRWPCLCQGVFERLKGSDVPDCEHTILGAAGEIPTIVAPGDGIDRQRLPEPKPPASVTRIHFPCRVCPKPGLASDRFPHKNMGICTQPTEHDDKKERRVVCSRECLDLRALVSRYRPRFSHQGRDSCSAIDLATAAPGVRLRYILPPCWCRG